MAVPEFKRRVDLEVKPPAKACNYKLQPRSQSYAATRRMQTRKAISPYEKRTKTTDKRTESLYSKLIMHKNKVSTVK